MNVKNALVEAHRKFGDSPKWVSLLPTSESSSDHDCIAVCTSRDCLNTVGTQIVTVVSKVPHNFKIICFRKEYEYYVTEKHNKKVPAYTREMRTKNIPPPIGSTVFYNINPCVVNTDDLNKLLPWVGEPLKVVAHVNRTEDDKLFFVLISEDLSFTDCVSSTHILPTKYEEDIQKKESIFEIVEKYSEDFYTGTIETMIEKMVENGDINFNLKKEKQ